MSLRNRIAKAAQVATKRNGLGDINPSIATDILQTKIVHSLFSGMTRDLLLVKGGVAMKMLTGSERDTTDIDFATAPDSNVNTIRSHMNAAIDNALRLGLIEDAKVREQDVSHGGLSPKWHISGKLAGTESRIHLKIEVSRRDLLPEEAISRFEYTPSRLAGVGRFTVRTYSPMAMAASKVAALLDSKRHKARDIYDLAVLIETEVEPPVEMLAALGKDAIENMLGYLVDKVFSMGYESFTQDIAPYLPREISEAISKDCWEDMQIKVCDHVQQWLIKAKGISADPVPRSELKHHFEDIKSRRME